MRIKLNRCDHMDDWYTIVRTEHDGREWWKETGPNSSSFMSSERLSPEACIEGDREQMIAIAGAIQQRESATFKRVAVHFAEDGVHFCSPKNSEVDAVVTIEEAEELAAQIVAELTANAEITAAQRAG